MGSLDWVGGKGGVEGGLNVEQQVRARREITATIYIAYVVRVVICRRFLADEVPLSKLLPTNWLPDLLTVVCIWGALLNPYTARSLTIRLSASLRMNTSKDCPNCSRVDPSHQRYDCAI